MVKTRELLRNQDPCIAYGIAPFSRPAPLKEPQWGVDAREGEGINCPKGAGEPCIAYGVHTPKLGNIPAFLRALRCFDAVDLSHPTSSATSRALGALPVS